jgi:predicted metal-dependent phosphoesterase TrpH
MPEATPPRYPCDLHCHTNRSDGNDTPRELIDAAAALGLRAIGLTDHDIDPPRTVEDEGGRTVDIAAYAAARGVVLAPGYEFSCDTHVDDVHLCGYGLDWNHPDLQAEVLAARRSKSKAYEDLCAALTAKGMPVDWEADVLTARAAAGAIIRRDPEKVQRKHIFEAMAARGHAATWSEAKLRVRDDPDLNIPRKKIDPVIAIALIHRCGGTAVLAHPHLIDEELRPPGSPPMTRGAYIDRLIEAGLDGIEARYSYDKTTYKGSLTPEAIEEEVRRVYGGRVRFLSGGSDYHADQKKGAQVVRRLGERGLSWEEFERTFRTR